MFVKYINEKIISIKKKDVVIVVFYEYSRLNITLQVVRILDVNNTGAYIKCTLSAIKTKCMRTSFNYLNIYRRR